MFRDNLLTERSSSCRTLIKEEREREKSKRGMAFAECLGLSVSSDSEVVITHSSVMRRKKQCNLTKLESLRRCCLDKRAFEAVPRSITRRISNEIWTKDALFSNS